MPGIAGIVRIRRCPEDSKALEAMILPMKHDHSSASGTFVDERLGLLAGWVSHTGSFSGRAPNWNERGDICLIFSGENYADKSEVGRLRAQGHQIESGNASYLVHLYEELGLSFLERINGWFSGLLVDLREQKIILFNDRYGLNRIFFCKHEDGFYFSSEAKSILRVLPRVRRFDLRSLGEFFSCGCVLQNRTLFAGISLMPAGSAWTFRPSGEVREEIYFRKDLWEQQPKLNRVEYYEKLKDTWRRILPRYFRGQEQIALSLTGGVDSRMILAWSPCPAGELTCYTFGGKYRDCADVKIAREVAKACGQKHQVIPVGNEFLSRFPGLAKEAVYLSDGGLDVTGSIDLYVEEIVRQFAPVRVTGTNGGEILRSLVAFKPVSLCTDPLDPDLVRSTSDAAVTYAEELRGHRLSFTAFKQSPWYMGSKFVVERSKITLRMPYFDNELVAMAYQAPLDRDASKEACLRVIADGNPALRKIGTDRGGVVWPIPGFARAHQLVQEFTYKAEYAYDYGMPHWLAQLDQGFAALHLERLFLGRHKFHHFRVFYRDELSQYLRDVLLDPRTLDRSYLRGGAVAEMVNGHLKGKRNYTLEIHKLLTMELVQRELIERN
jgi:asparagine synthase (glutamine-hydrolysing)